MTYTFVLTLEQINEIVYLMSQGPYARVNAIIQELQKQSAPQNKPPEPPSPPPPKPNGEGVPHVDAPR